MRLLLATVLGLAVSSVFAKPAFEVLSVEAARLSAAESARFERMKKAPGVTRAKLIAIDEEVLSQGLLELSLFKGVKGVFTALVDTKEGVWKGRGKNFDRFSIRKVNGKYTGHVLFEGRRYVLTPIASGISVLYEPDSEFVCGAENEN